MPVCTVNLVQLSTTLPNFLSAIGSAFPTASTRPLVVARVIRWMIVPSTIAIDPLLTNMTWDLLLILRGPDGLPGALRELTRAVYTLSAGIPSRIVDSFPATNAALLHPPKGSVPALTGALARPRIARSAQKLEYTEAMGSWLQAYDPHGDKGAVSMLNLLAFHAGAAAHAEYMKYGKAFAESIGKRRGGNAKIVGKVVRGGENAGPEALNGEGWDEVALAHYPSVRHFADMAASEDYQEVNHRHRVGSLRDTCILMTSEVAFPGMKGLWDGIGRANL